MLRGEDAVVVHVDELDLRGIDIGHARLRKKLTDKGRTAGALQIRGGFCLLDLAAAQIHGVHRDRVSTVIQRQILHHRRLIQRRAVCDRAVALEIGVDHVDLNGLTGAVFHSSSKNTGPVAAVGNDVKAGSGEGKAQALAELVVFVYGRRIGRTVAVGAEFVLVHGVITIAQAVIHRLPQVLGRARSGPGHFAALIAAGQFVLFIKDIAGRNNGELDPFEGTIRSLREHIIALRTTPVGVGRHNGVRTVGTDFHAAVLAAVCCDVIVRILLHRRRRNCNNRITDVCHGVQTKVERAAHRGYIDRRDLKLVGRLRIRRRFVNTRVLCIGRKLLAAHTIVEQDAVDADEHLVAGMAVSNVVLRIVKARDRDRFSVCGQLRRDVAPGFCLKLRFGQCFVEHKVAAVRRRAGQEGNLHRRTARVERIRNFVPEDRIGIERNIRRRTVYLTGDRRRADLLENTRQLRLIVSRIEVAIAGLRARYRQIRRFRIVGGQNAHEFVGREIVRAIVLCFERDLQTNGVDIRAKRLAVFRLRDRVVGDVYSLRIQVNIIRGTVCKHDHRSIAIVCAQRILVIRARILEDTISQLHTQFCMCGCNHLIIVT